MLRLPDTANRNKMLLKKSSRKKGFAGDISPFVAGSNPARDV